MSKSSSLKSFESLLDMEVGGEVLADAYGSTGPGCAEKKPKKPAKLNTEAPWSHDQRRLGMLYVEASPEEREKARMAYRTERLPQGGGGLIEELPPMTAKKAFEAGWLNLEDSAWSMWSESYGGRLADVFAQPTLGNLSLSRSPVPLDCSAYSLLERIALIGFVESWLGGCDGWQNRRFPLGPIGAARLASFAVARDKELVAGVDKVALDFGMAVAKRTDMEGAYGEELSDRIKRLRVAFEAVGVTKAAMARAVAGLAVFSHCKPLREMLSTGMEEAPKPGKQAWMQALRGAVGVDDARVALMVCDAAMADGIDLLGASCRWKNASAMRSAMGLACELGSIECARAFGERGAASGVAVLDGRLLESANPLISLVDKCLAGYLHPKGGIDGGLWAKAFAGVFAAIGREISSEPEAERMMDEMGQRLELRPAELKKMWDKGARNVNLGSYCGKVLNETAVAATTSMLVRALMLRWHPEPKEAPEGVKDKPRMRL